MSAPERDYQAWLARGQNDLLNIRNNIASNIIPWDTVVFHAHQAVEKHLKALLVARGKQPPRTHDLVNLLRACLSFESSLKRFEDHCRAMNLFYASSRYPQLSAPTEQEARALAAAAEELSGVVQRLVLVQP